MSTVTYLPFTVLKGLVIDDPWIQLILDGQKTWEMRSSSIRHRGPIGLIRKGSGRVFGVADVIDCKKISASDFAKFEPHHRISPGDQATVARKWPIAWVLGNVRLLPVAVPYRHKKGAQSRIKFSQDESNAIQFSDPFAQKREIHRISLTEGNIRNSSLPLNGLMHAFPADAVGGANRSLEARRKLAFKFDPGDGTLVRTDIDGQKQILRDRAAVKSFYDRIDAKPNDGVEIEQQFDTYVVRPAKND